MQQLKIAETIHVSALNNIVNQGHLHTHFSQIGPVKEIFLRSSKLQPDKRYAFVVFHSSDDARKALFQLNYSSILGKQCRVAPYTPARAERLKSSENMVLTNLAHIMTEKDTHDALSEYGSILSVRVSNKESKAFVTFLYDEDAFKATRAVHNTELFGNLLHAEFTGASNESPEIAIKNLDKSIGVRVLAGLLSRYGELQSCRIDTDPDGNASGTASAVFEEMKEAVTATAAIDGILFGSSKIQVILKSSSPITPLNQNWRNNTLYVNNLHQSIDRSNLKELFSSYGQITECRIIYGPNGISKGFGFVTFNSNNNAKVAATNLNSYNLKGKNISVSFYKKKKANVKKVNKKDKDTKNIPQKLSYDQDSQENRQNLNQKIQKATEDLSTTSSTSSSLDSSIKSHCVVDLSPDEDKERLTSLINDVKSIAYSLASIITKIPTN